MLGPTWKGMFGKQKELTDGSFASVDEAYFIESVTDPNAKIVKGYPAIMPAANLSEEALAALIAFVKSLSEQPGPIPAESAVTTDGEPQASGPSENNLVEQGRLLAQQRGCIACHTTDGNRGVGPTWLGLYGSTKELADGSTVVADNDYLAKAINQPNIQVVKSFSAIMPAAGFTKTETDAVIAFIKSISQ